MSMLIRGLTVDEYRAFAKARAKEVKRDIRQSIRKTLGEPEPNHRSGLRARRAR